MKKVIVAPHYFSSSHYRIINRMRARSGKEEVHWEEVKKENLEELMRCADSFANDLHALMIDARFGAPNPLPIDYVGHPARNMINTFAREYPDVQILVCTISPSFREKELFSGLNPNVVGLFDLASQHKEIGDYL